MNKAEKLAHYQKIKQALVMRLLGAGYHRAMNVLHWAESFTIQPDGEYETRKDGITPRFFHEIRQANMAFTLLSGMPKKFREDLIITILLHDLMEDYDVAKSLVKEKAGKRAFKAAWCMTKVYKGVKKSDDQVFMDISNNPLASVAKLLDRIDNFQTCIGVFKVAMIKSYMEECVKHFMPMAKRARKNFPRQYDLYLNLTTVLKYQMEMLEFAITPTTTEDAA